MLIIVDGANVVGSRPDGWWRDRAGAARALAERLDASLAGSSGLRVVLVLEGAARAGVPPACQPGAPLRVVHASGSGDDAVVSAVAAADEPVVAVTADRALRARVLAAGGEVAGPSRLWELLARQQPT